MDPRTNPFAPGAGTEPPKLVGRDAELERAAIALDRIRNGLSARSFVFYGIRGVGKTVLLNRIKLDAESHKFATMIIEAPEGGSLLANLAPGLRSMLLKLSRMSMAKDALRRALSALAGFIGTLKIKYGDIEIAVDVEPQIGLADSGDLTHDLTELLVAVGEAARESGTAVVIFIDELQYFDEADLAVMITALHSISQKRLPLALIAAGLPNLLGQLGRAKTYAERLFEFVPMQALDPNASSQAIRRPVEERQAAIEDDALDLIVQDTMGYPYFLQEWGKHAWNAASGRTIKRHDAERAKSDALDELDVSFFRVRFDRLTDKEKEFLRGMAELGPGPHRSGDVAKVLGRAVSAVAVVRKSLIQKGMIYSPTYGEAAFTVPMFEDFLKRTMSESWKSAAS